jgi:Cu/Ag efflux protein CusF
MLMVLLAAGVASAQQPSSGQQPDSAQPPQASGEQAKEFKAEVVSVDATAKTITFKKTDAGMSAGTPETLTVDAKAENSLKKVSTGDRVKLVCRKDSTGMQIVDKIERVDTKPAGDQPPSP